jgi:hypothetical protein
MERHQQQSGKVYMRFQKRFICIIPNGWLQNCNSTHTQLLAQKVQRGKLFALQPDGESFRGINAVRLLSKGEKYTLVIADGYDMKLSILRC